MKDMFVILILLFVNTSAYNINLSADSLVLYLIKCRPLFIKQSYDTLLNPRMVEKVIGDSIVYSKSIKKDEFYKFIEEELPHYKKLQDIQNKLDLNALFYRMQMVNAKSQIPHAVIPRGNRGGELRTGFIEDETYFQLCIKMFRFGYPAMKDLAYKTLLTGSRNDFLKKYNSEIREGINLYRIEKSKDSTVQKRMKGLPEEVIKNHEKYSEYFDKLEPGDELLMMLPLNTAEKQEMLKKLPDIQAHKYYYYRARMGDKKAEKYFIERFEQSNNYNGKSKSAKTLGTIGAPDCAKALVRALNSPIRFTLEKKSYESVRIDIIGALGRIHPEVPFLRMDIAFIGKYSDQLYGGGEKIEEYLNRVLAWAKKTYGIIPTDPQPEPVLKPYMQKYVISDKEINRKPDPDAKYYGPKDLKNMKSPVIDITDEKK